MKQWQNALLASILLAGMGQVFAVEKKTVDIFKVNNDPNTHGIGEKIGEVVLQDSDKGLVIHPHLKGLSPGNHGFHIHDKPSCEAADHEGKLTPAMAAGGHLDPNNTGKHLGPLGNGHLGDLPILKVSQNGKTQPSLIAPHLKLKDVMDHSIMIHDGGDNYSDNPPMGGGGARIACGVIK